MFRLPEDLFTLSTSYISQTLVPVILWSCDVDSVRITVSSAQKVNRAYRVESAFHYKTNKGDSMITYGS